MSHLESILVEYLEWQGYLIRRNTKVGKLKHGGWEMELDVIAYNPHNGDLLHYEPSVDAHSWAVREARFKKKFEAARKYILKDVFSWLDESTKIRQVAVFPNKAKDKKFIAGGTRKADYVGRNREAFPTHVKSFGGSPSGFRPTIASMQFFLYQRLQNLGASFDYAQEALEDANR